MTINSLAGDPGNIQLLTEKMLSAFRETYLNAEEPMEFVDGIMAAHNVHKQIILDIIRRSEAGPSQQSVLLRSVKETWIRAMDTLVARVEEEFPSV